MIFLDNELTVFIDVDDTLIMYDNSSPRYLDILDPYSKYGTTKSVRPHARHIKLLKEFHVRGYVIVVWSAGGSRWAKAVVDALDLEQYVTIVMSKPLKHVDDLKAVDIMGTRIYLNEKGNTQNVQEENS